MDYSEQQKKSELEQKLLKNQALVVIFIFIHIMGTITLIFLLPKSLEIDVLDIISAVIAPMSALGWFYFSKELYNFKASIYNCFGSGHLYRQLFIFWGNRRLPIAALILSLLISSLSFSKILENREFVIVQKKLDKTGQELGELRNSIDKVKRKSDLGSPQQKALNQAILKIDSIRENLVKPLDKTEKLKIKTQ